MRVSAMVKDYIHHQVRQRLMTKYEAEKAEATRQSKFRDDILDEAQAAAQEAIAAVLKEAEQKEPGILDINWERVQECGWAGRGVTCKTLHQVESCHGWYLRLEKEVKEVERDIIIELELGGTKADLERLLDKVEKEVSENG